MSNIKKKYRINKYKKKIQQINEDKPACTPLIFALLCFLDYVVLLSPGGADKNNTIPHHSQRGHDRDFYGGTSEGSESMRAKTRSQMSQAGSFHPFTY